MGHLLLRPYVLSVLTSCVTSTSGLKLPAPLVSTAREAFSFETDLAPAASILEAARASEAKVYSPGVVVGRGELASGPWRVPGWSNRLLVVPRLKFAFCYVEKNACTQFNILMDRLNAPTTWSRAAEFGIDMWLNASVDKFGLDASEITRANGWRKAMFLRNPSERFLSAWASKCVPGQSGGYENGGDCCLGGELLEANASAEEQVESFERVVREILPEYTHLRDDENAGAYNAHYDQQTHFCGGAAGVGNLGELDYVGFIGGQPNSTHIQVRTMLELVAGVSGDDLRKIDLDSIFPPDSVANHNTGASHRVAEFYRNASILKAVEAAFKDDTAAIESLRAMGLGVTHPLVASQFVKNDA